MAEDLKNIIWPEWETVKLIGKGSFGAVYEIHKDILGDVEKAALKVISIPQNAGDIDEMYSDGFDEESITSTFQSHLKSIIAEYSMMRKMNGCPNIVNCDDVRYVQHDDGIGWDIFIKMELLTPLAKALSAEIPEDTVIKLGVDICHALEMCSKHGVIHRDIKPQNIFVSESGDFKLGDFGIAKTVEKTMGGTKIGTYKYMAPEVYNNQPYGSGADIYSLGLVLYWMLNERRMPFLPLPPEKLKAGMDESSRNRRLSGEPLPAPAHGSAVLKHIVMKACAYNPKERYLSAAAMLADLTRLQSGAAVLPLSHTEAGQAEPVNMAKPETISEAEQLPKKTAEATSVHPVAEINSPNKTEEKPTRQTPPKKKNNKLVPMILALAAVVVLILLLLRFCGSNGDISATEPAGTEPPGTQVATFAMPDVVGTAFEQAEEQLTAQGLIVSAEYEKNDTVPENSIISQSIPAGDDVTKGTQVLLTVSSGKSTVEVADVVGKPEKEAIQTLEAQGFTVDVQHSFDSAVAAGMVISQEPKANTSQLPGAKITISVSKGAQLVQVVFDAVGGNVSTKTKTVHVGAAFGELPVPIRTGYAFVGWYTESGMNILDSSVVSTAEDITLYARWSAETCTVIFNANGGTVSTGSKTVNYDSTYGTMPTPARTGYTFTGWYTAAAGGTKITEGTKVNNASNVTLYAQWTANTYKVTFNANGGTVSTGSKTVNYDSTYGTMPTPARTGYTFTGWYTAAAGGTKITESTKVNNASNVTLYAQWTANPYKVTFNANGGSVSTGSKTVTFNATYGSLPTPSRTGYTFLGWYTTASGSTEITESTKVSNASNHTLYAQWEQNSLSGWVDQSAVPSNASIVNTKTVYRYRDKSYTTSSNKTLSGWTLYDTTKAAGSWESWSAWSTSQTYEISDRVADYDVRSKTQYRYVRFACSENSKHGWWGYKCNCQVSGCTGKINESAVQFIWLDTSYSYAQANWVNGADSGNVKKTTIDGVCWYYWKSNNDQYRADATRTVYSVRYKYYVFTYHFYKWSSWSSWQDSYVSETSNRDVETKTMYQYRIN